MKKILIVGGTGFLGNALSIHLLKNEYDVCVCSRSEDKHRQIKSINTNIKSILMDVRNYQSCLDMLRKFKPDIVVAAQALKQIDICEQFPYETALTNIIGTQNLCKAIEEYGLVDKALYISTDKVPKCSTFYGISKAAAERLHLAYNFQHTVNNCVRYGNILGSTGSIIPIFKQKLLNGQNIQITDPNMTRFFLSIDDAINLIMLALKDTNGKRIFIPKAKSAKIIDIAELMIEKYNPSSKIENIGVRNLEKINEIFFCDDEFSRIQKTNDGFIIHDIFSKEKFNDVNKEYSSGDPENLMSKEELKIFLKDKGVI